MPGADPGVELQSEQDKSESSALLNQRGSTKGKMQRYDAMLEQIGIRKAELSQRVLHLKTSESEQNGQMEELQNAFEALEETVSSLKQQYQEADQKITGADGGSLEPDERDGSRPDQLPQRSVKARILKEHHRAVRRLWKQYSEGHGAERPESRHPRRCGGSSAGGEKVRDGDRDRTWRQHSEYCHRQ